MTLNTPVEVDSSLKSIIGVNAAIQLEEQVRPTPVNGAVNLGRDAPPSSKHALTETTYNVLG
jgi:hypothetical protein